MIKCDEPCDNKAIATIMFMDGRKKNQCEFHLTKRAILAQFATTTDKIVVDVIRLL